MIPEGKDGIDFINIYSKGATLLGKWMTNFAYSPFIIDIDGEHHQFSSVEGLWYWLLTVDDSLKNCYGYEAKNRGKEILKQKQAIQPPNREEIVKKAIDEKIKNNPEKMRELAESVLPFTHFYEYGAKRIDVKHEWITLHWEERRKQLKKYYGITK